MLGEAADQLWGQCQSSGQAWRDSSDHCIMSGIYRGGSLFLGSCFQFMNYNIYQIVTALLESSDVGINTRTPEGWTALVAAADKGHHGLVRSLLKHPATDVNVRDNQSEY